MGDLPADLPERRNLADLVARIERQQAETRKFVAEQAKLAAEADKLRRDRFLAPILAVVATPRCDRRPCPQHPPILGAALTPDRLRECLALLRWSQRGLADVLGYDDHLVRR